MPATRTSRLLALTAAAILVIGGSCNRGNDEPEDVDVTDAPVETPHVEAVADFQLVGLIDEAFAGQLPPVDLPDDFDLDDDDDTKTSPSPAASPVGITPTRGGIIRLQIEDLSEGLSDACGLAADDIVEVFWTTDTFFEPEDVLDDVEDEIEDRTAGMVGKIFRTEGADDTVDDTPEATAGATGSPAATGSPEARAPATDCILVAEQIAFTQTTLPTPGPRAVTRRTAAPTPVRTTTPTPKPTATAEDTFPPTPPTDEPGSPSPSSS